MGRDLPVNRLGRDFLGYPDEADEEAYRQFKREVRSWPGVHSISEAEDIAEEDYDRPPRGSRPRE